MAAQAPYIYSILKGKTTPHLFTWLVWSITTTVIFFAQVKSHSGVGAWPIGFSALVTIFIACLAYTKRESVKITPSDWIFLIMALSSIPLWYFTANPLWAIVILTGTDLCGFGPTILKAYRQPYSEPILFFLMFFIQNIFILLALETYSLATLLFPVSIGSSCLLVVFLLAIRRKSLFLNL